MASSETHEAFECIHCGIPIDEGCEHVVTFLNPNPHATQEETMACVRVNSCGEEHAEMIKSIGAVFLFATVIKTFQPIASLDPKLVQALDSVVTEYGAMTSAEKSGRDMTTLRAEIFDSRRMRRVDRKVNVYYNLEAKTLDTPPGATYRSFDLGMDMRKGMTLGEFYDNKRRPRTIKFSGIMAGSVDLRYRVRVATRINPGTTNMADYRLFGIKTDPIHSKVYYTPINVGGGQRTIMFLMFGAERPNRLNAIHVINFSKVKGAKKSDIPLALRRTKAAIGEMPDMDPWHSNGIGCTTCGGGGCRNEDHDHGENSDSDSDSDDEQDRMQAAMGAMPSMDPYVGCGTCGGKNKKQATDDEEDSDSDEDDDQEEVGGRILAPYTTVVPMYTLADVVNGDYPSTSTFGRYDVRSRDNLRHLLINDASMPVLRLNQSMRTSNRPFFFGRVDIEFHSARRLRQRTKRESLSALITGPLDIVEASEPANNWLRFTEDPMRSAYASDNSGTRRIAIVGGGPGSNEEPVFLSDFYSNNRKRSRFVTLTIKTESDGATRSDTKATVLKSVTLRPPADYDTLVTQASLTGQKSLVFLAAIRPEQKTTRSQIGILALEFQSAPSTKKWRFVRIMYYSAAPLLANNRVSSSVQQEQDPVEGYLLPTSTPVHEALNLAAIKNSHLSAMDFLESPKIRESLVSLLELDEKVSDISLRSSLQFGHRGRLGYTLDLEFHMPGQIVRRRIHRSKVSLVSTHDPINMLDYAVPRTRTAIHEDNADRAKWETPGRSSSSGTRQIFLLDDDRTRNTVAVFLSDFYRNKDGTKALLVDLQLMDADVRNDAVATVLKVAQSYRTLMQNANEDGTVTIAALASVPTVRSEEYSQNISPATHFGVVALTFTPVVTVEGGKRMQLTRIYHYVANKVLGMQRRTPRRRQ